MGMIEELGVYLTVQSTRFVLGRSLFLNGMPDGTTGAATCLTEYPGLPAIEKFSGDLPAFERPRVQIMTRSTGSVGGAGLASSTKARAISDVAWRAMIKVANRNLPTSTSGSYYLRVEPLQSPAFMGRDESGRTRIGFNCTISRVVT